jgi:hypothetical protein
MHLTAHSDPRVHARCVMRTTAMRSIPEAAVPKLDATVWIEAGLIEVESTSEGSEARESSRTVTTRRWKRSSSRPRRYERREAIRLFKLRLLDSNQRPGG